MEAGLREGLAALGLQLGDGQVGQLLRYVELLQKWGRVYNLTALLGPDEVLSHHLLDSLAVVPPIRRHGARKLLDVGSGAGLPGAVIAIACPDVAVDCIDTVAKKAAFIQQVAGTLGLPNLRGIHGRVESWPQTYPLVTSRAFGSLADFVRLTDRALAVGGHWAAMKGKFPAEEASALPADVEMFHVEQLRVPGLDAERCLVWMRRRDV